MFVAQYRKTMAGAAARSVKLHESGEDKLAVLSEAREKAKRIVLGAEAEAAAMLIDATKRSKAILEAAKTEAERILSRAGLEASEFGDKPDMLSIIKAVAIKHKVSVAAIKGTGKPDRVVAARFEAIARIYEARPDLSLPQIGKVFRRDHTTILNAVRKFGVYRGGEHHDNEGGS